MLQHQNQKRISFYVSSILMNDVKFVRFDDKYLFIVLQITYFTGLPKSPDRTLFWLVGDRGEDEHTFIKHTL